VDLEIFEMAVPMMEQIVGSYIKDFGKIFRKLDKT
jgi:hypothetical protein